MPRAPWRRPRGRFSGPPEGETRVCIWNDVCSSGQGEMALRAKLNLLLCAGLLAGCAQNSADASLFPSPDGGSMDGGVSDRGPSDAIGGSTTGAGPALGLRRGRHHRLSRHQRLSGTSGSAATTGAAGTATSGAGGSLGAAGSGSSGVGDAGTSTGFGEMSGPGAGGGSCRDPRPTGSGGTTGAGGDQAAGEPVAGSPPVRAAATPAEPQAAAAPAAAPEAEMPAGASSTWTARRALSSAR